MTVLVYACSTIRNMNYRLAGKAFMKDKHGQMQLQKAGEWVEHQIKDYFSAAKGLVKDIKVDFSAGTFSPELRAWVSSLLHSIAGNTSKSIGMPT